MGKDNTGLLMIAGVAALFFLLPKEKVQQYLPSGGGATTIDLGGITTAIPGASEGVETGFSQLQQRLQQTMFDLQLQGMRSAFDFQLAGLKNLVTNLPGPQQIFSGGSGLPSIQEIIDQVKGGLNLPDLPGLPGLPGMPDQGKTEEGKEDKWGTTPYWQRIFGPPPAISEAGFYQDFMNIFFPDRGDGKNDSPEASQNLPEPGQAKEFTMGVFDIPGFQFPGGKRYFLPSGGETTWDIFQALRAKGYPYEEIFEAPDKPEAQIDAYAPTAADYSSPASPWYGAGM